jgi:hypothetical protein
MGRAFFIQKVRWNMVSYDIQHIGEPLNTMEGRSQSFSERLAGWLRILLFSRHGHGQERDKRPTDVTVEIHTNQLGKWYLYAHSLHNISY